MIAALAAAKKGLVKAPAEVPSFDETKPELKPVTAEGDGCQSSASGSAAAALAAAGIAVIKKKKKKED